MSPARWVAAWLGASALGSVAFAYVYRTGATLGPITTTEILGPCLALAFGGLALALVAWSRALLPQIEIAEPLESGPSAPTEVDAAVAAFERGETLVVDRHAWLVRLGATVAGMLGLALLFPIRSLGRTSPYGVVGTSSWEAGVALVLADGRPVTLDLLATGSALTAFPAGETSPADEVAMAYDMLMVVRVDPAELNLPPGRADWAPQGVLAYSKLCTHAGCPVALYRAASHQLFCPCHQSTFDVLNGASVVFGPAARALPQLPLRVDGAGRLSAGGKLSGPVGPDVWEFPA